MSLRLLPALAGAVCVAAAAFAVALALASLGRNEPPAMRHAAPVALASASAAQALMEVADVVGAATQQLAAQRARRVAHARTLELRRLSRSLTVRAALRRMWLAGAINRARYLHARGTLWRAERTLHRLRGARARELAAVLALPARLAQRRLLTSSRLSLVLLTVRRNAQFWAAAPFPVAGKRITFARDPVVFRYEGGQGLHVHMLGTAGKVNGLARDCAHRPTRCNRPRLRLALARLLQVSSRRGGFVAWESLYRYGGGTPPWISAMTQGTAIQALARGARALDEPALLQQARRALGAFEQPPPVGISVRAPGGRSYLMYSFAPRLRIINGFLQAITGVHDLATVSGSARARRIFGRGDRAARAMLASFDTGAWSLYHQGGRETNLEYHRLTAAFLRNLCRRTRARIYCGEARRLGIYERQPPRIGVVRLRGLRTRRPVRIAFALSKVSDVRVAMASRSGAVVLRRARLGRGAHDITWVPRRRGRYRLQIVATGLSGPRGVAVRDLVVHPRRGRKPAKRPG